MNSLLRRAFSWSCSGLSGVFTYVSRFLSLGSFSLFTCKFGSTFDDHGLLTTFGVSLEHNSFNRLTELGWRYSSGWVGSRDLGRSSIYLSNSSFFIGLLAGDFRFFAKFLQQTLFLFLFSFLNLIPIWSRLGFYRLNDCILLRLKLVTHNLLHLDDVLCFGFLVPKVGSACHFFCYEGSSLVYQLLLRKSQLRSLGLRLKLHSEVIQLIKPVSVGFSTLFATRNLKNMVLSIYQNVESWKHVLLVKHLLNLFDSLGRKLASIDMPVVVLPLLQLNSFLLRIDFSHSDIVFKKWMENLFVNPVSSFFGLASWQCHQEGF